MAGTVVADKWQNGDGTENYKCKAWVNFNGTGTVAIRASGNVSSITDNDTGEYTVNFTIAMPDASYSMQLTCQGNGSTSRVFGAIKIGITPTTTTVRVASIDESTAAAVDPLIYCVNIFR